MSRRITLSRRSALGFAALLLALAAALAAPREALTAWLAAFVLCSAPVLGGLFFMMLADIIPGSWRTTIRPPARMLASLLPALVWLCLPVLLGMSLIFPWYTGAGLSGFRAFYLTPSGLAVRLIAILGGGAWLAARLSRGPQRVLSIVGLIAFILLDGILATDLVLSLDPEFHSSGFGLYFMSMQALTAFALIIVLRLSQSAATPNECALLGALLLTLLLCWSYFDFMQYFIIWSGNLPARADWFTRRSEGLWHILALALAALRLAPTFLLLFPPVRQSRTWLVILAGMMLAGSLIEVAWLVFPELEHVAWAVPSYLLASLGMILILPSSSNTSFEGVRPLPKREAHEGA